LIQQGNFVVAGICSTCKTLYEKLFSAVPARETLYLISNHFQEQSFSGE
jgi:hypothetical protein